MKNASNKILTLLLVLFMLSGALLCETPVYAVSISSFSKNLNTQETTFGWVKKGNATYYRLRNGKLCKNTEKKIGKYVYRFDKKGKLIKGSYQVGKLTYHYNTHNGRFENISMKLKITRTSRGIIFLKNGSETYKIEQNSNLRLYNKSGKKLSFSKLKKGKIVQVYFDGNIFETDPMEFSNIYKIIM